MTNNCVYPKCPQPGCTRGLCHGHYQGARRMIRYGETTEANLTARGLMLPAAQAGPSNSGRLPCYLFRESRPEMGDAYLGGPEGRIKLAAEARAKREARIRFESGPKTVTEPKTEPFGDSHDEIAAEPETEDFADFDDTEETP